MTIQLPTYEHWPVLPYDEFKTTAYLLHRATQVIGKLKLLAPFEPQWAHVVLYINGRGLTTGLIPYAAGAFEIEIDLISHQIICQTTWGRRSSFVLQSMSVAELTKKFFNILQSLDLAITINTKPQEVPDPIDFEQDKEERVYNATLANAWWRILVSSFKVMQRYHARFIGKTQPIGFMWGTFDLRDVRFKGDNIVIPGTGINAGYLRRNALDAAQIEAGWWSGNPLYPKAAYYSFTFPQPDGIEQAKIKPHAARWDNNLGEFILDYDDLRQSKEPEKDLLDFFESTYQAGAERAGWYKQLIGPGKPL